MGTRRLIRAAGLSLALMASFNAAALEVSAVEIYDHGVAKTRVIGQSGVRFDDIYMEGELIAQSDANGRFSVTTPVRGFGCIAFFEDDEAFVRVLVKNCDSTPRGFYSTDQVQYALPAQTSGPLFTIEVKATCDPGDLAINWFGGSPVDFAIRFSGMIQLGSTNEQSWLLVVHSLASVDSTIAIGAICADIWPRHGLTDGGHVRKDTDK